MMTSAQVEHLPNTAAGRHKILIVDDEQDNVDLLFRLFRRDFDVLKATSGEQGLELTKQHGDDIAVIVSDMKMPGISGAEFLKRSIAFAPMSTRIILSGYSDSADLLTAINDAKVYLYLVKPFDHEKLREHVDIGLELYRQRLMEERHDEPEQAEAEIERDFAFDSLWIHTTVLNETEGNKEIRTELDGQRLFMPSAILAPEGSKAVIEIGYGEQHEVLRISGEVKRCRLASPKGMEISLQDVDYFTKKRLAALFPVEPKKA